MNKHYIVYVLEKENGYITAVDSSAFLTDTTGWVEIDRGTGDKYHHAQGNYFPEALTTAGGAYRYRLADGAVRECTAKEIEAQEEANRPAQQPETTVWEELDAAYQKGVDSV